MASNAKVNEVLDEHALLKKYEREIARLQELVRVNGNKEYLAQMEELDMENLYLKEQVRYQFTAFRPPSNYFFCLCVIFLENLKKLWRKKGKAGFKWPEFWKKH